MWLTILSAIVFPIGVWVLVIAFQSRVDENWRVMALVGLVMAILSAPVAFKAYLVICVLLFGTP